ncbi:RloB family protein [Thomasclavelia sp.]|uniref:RloB family protein n=1 Tax=Thomasclavelia sp. TaxID=3025757 RepID=UPI0025EC2D86|nr:RloB family protein [Thomasclavelia sp.]
MSRNERKGRRKPRMYRGKIRTPKLGYYYIVTDTDQTEKNYLEGVRDSIPENLKGKIVIKVSKTRTINLVKTCKEGASLFPQYSEPWIVFDRDQVKNFDGIIKEAKQNGIHVGWSNPCLEIWLFAYFGSMPNIQDSITCCKRFAFEYERKTGQRYDKAERNLYNKLCHYGNEGKAIKIAREKRKQCLDEKLTEPSKMIPCTTVDILINEIKAKVTS